MKKQDLPFLPQFFDRYINLTEDLELIDALSKYSTDWLSQDIAKMQQLGNQIYAEDKWTAKDILQHIIDTERIMAYRALRMSRNDKTPLPGFEENDFAKNTMANERSILDLMEEFATVRQSTILLFKNMTAAMQLNVGTASNQAITPLALGFTIVGHAVHHINVLRERYFPMLENA